MHHVNLKNISFFFAFLFVSAIAFYFVQENNKDYIGGNILNLTFFEEIPTNSSTVAPAWVANGLVCKFLFDPLILANHDATKFTPRLIENYEILNNGLVYKFIMKDNLKWSDGMPLTADDVVYCIDLIRSLENVNPIYGNAFAKIMRVENNGKTITLTLNDTHAGFLTAISQFLIYPKHILSEEGLNMPMAEFWENPIGSGMYKLTEKNERYYVLQKNELHSGKEPKIETIRLHKDPTLRVDMYIATNISDMENFRNMRGFTEYTLPIHFYRYFVFNIAGDDGHTNPPMQDINVRNAIPLAIDNYSILLNMYANITTATTLLDKHPYDQAKAKELLTNSKYDLNRPLRVGYYYTNPNSKYFVESVASYLENIGFTIEYVVENSLQDFYDKRHFDILFKDISVTNTTDWYAEFFKSSDIIFGTNGKHDLRLKQILQTQDRTRQKELIDNFDAQLKKELYRYPVLGLNQSVYVHTDRIKLPANQQFGNPWQVLDINFEDWEIKKD